MANLSILAEIVGRDMLSPAVHGATASLNGLETAGTRVNRAMGAMAGAAATAMVAAGAALVGGVALGIKAAGDLEQAVANISTIKPEIDTSQVFTALNEMQTRVPQSAAQLGDALYNIFSSVDVSVEQGIALTEKFARGAVGAQTDAQTFGTAVLGVMNAYGLAVQDADHVSDVFFNTVKLGVVTGQELAGNFGIVTSAAKAAGVDIDTLGGLIAGVTKEGGPAAQNINNLANMLMKINTTEAQGAMAKLGVQTVDTAGRFREVPDVLTDLKGALGKLTEAERLSAMQKIFPDLQARQGAQVIMSQLDFVKDAINSNIHDSGAAAAAFEKMNATFNSQIKILQNTFMSILTTVGAAILPVITPIITAFSKALPGAMATAGAAISGFLAPLQSVGRYMAVVGETGDYMNDSISDVPGVMRGAVIGVGAFVTTLGGFGRYLSTVVETGDYFNDFLADIPEPIRGAAQAMGQLIVQLGLFGRYLSTVVETGDYMNDFLADLPEPIRGAAQAMGEALVGLESFITEHWQAVLVGAFGAVGVAMVVSAGLGIAAWLPVVLPLAAVGVAIAVLYEAWQQNLGGIQEQTQEFYEDTIKPVFSGLVNWFKERIPGAMEWLIKTGWPTLQKAGQTFVDFLQGPAATAFENIRKWLADNLPPAFEKLTNDVIPAIQGAFNTLTNEVLPAAGTALDTLSRWVQNAWDWLVKLNTAATEKGVYTDLTEAWNNLQVIAFTLAGGVAAVFDPSSRLNTLLSGESGLARSSSTTADNFKTLSGAVKDFTDFARALLDPLGKMVEGLAIMRALTSGPAFGSPVFDLPKFLKDSGINAPGWTGLDHPAPRYPGAPSEGGILNPTPGAPPVLGPILGPPAPTGNSMPTGAIDNSSRDAFLNSLAPYAISAAQQTSLPASPFLSIPLNEQGWQKPAPGNNYFGIKASRDWTGATTEQPTWEDYGQGAVQTTATFRAYDNPGESFIDFANFLKENPRYAGALSVWADTGDPVAFIKAVHGAGYATDPNWSNQIIKLMGEVDPIINQAAAAPPSITVAPPAATASSTPQNNQFVASDLGLLSWNEAAAACGPAAVTWFMERTGRLPDGQEAQAIANVTRTAQQAGQWDIKSGTHGPIAFQAMAAAQGVETAIDWTPTAEEAAGLAGAGTPFAISTSDPSTGRGHYFQVSGQNEAGEFNVGGSGLALKGGSEFMSLERIEALTGPMNAIITLSGQMGDAITTTGGEFGAAAAGMADSLTPLGDAAIATAVGVVDATGQMVVGFDEFGNAIYALPDAMAGTGEAFDTLTGAAGVMGEATVGAVDEMGNAITGLPEVIGEPILGAVEAIAPLNDSLLGIGESGAEMASVIGETTGAMQEQATAAVESMAEGTVAGAEGMNTGVVDAVTAMSGSSIELMDGMGGLVAESAGAMGEETSGAVAAMGDAVISTIDTMGSDVIAAADTMGSDVAAAADQMQDAVTGAVDTMAGDSVESTDGMSGDIQDILSSLADEAASLGEGIGDSLADGLTSGLDSAVSAVRSSARKIISEAEAAAEAAAGIASPSKLFAEIGEQLGLGVAEGIHNSLPVVSDAARELVAAPDMAYGGLGNGVVPRGVGSAGSDGIDYDRLAKAIAAAMSGTGKTVNVYPAQASLTEEGLLRELAREELRERW